FKLSTALMAVHTDCYAPIGLIQQGGPRRRETRLLARLADKPVLTLYALLAELSERGVMVSCDTLWRYFKRQGRQLQKNVFATEQDRPEVWWKPHQSKIDPCHLSLSTRPERRARWDAFAVDLSVLPSACTNFPMD
ncbi:hypothetical protein ABIC09_001224, partial [Bradyrhizobium sp. S3.12.5]